MNEQEIKLRVRDLNEMREKLHKLGAIVHKARHFEENSLLDTSDQSLRKNRNALRVRIVHNKGLLTFKGPADTSAGIKSREEIECPVSDSQKLLQILARLGYAPIFRYEKYRTVYHITGVKMDFCLDETPIGNFLELEGEPAGIHDFAGKLGYTTEDYITLSYAALYFQWAAENGIQPAHMVFP